MKINIQVFGSTSSGNCTLIWDDTTAIMIDCGFSRKYVKQCLGELQLDFSDVTGLLLTHTHGDHVNNPVINKLVREKVPIFCHENIQSHLTRKYESARAAKKYNLLSSMNSDLIDIGTFQIQSFKVPHDSEGGCYGFNIFQKSESGQKKITISTDIGYPENILIKQFVDSDIIIIESNHDTTMLENSNRPWILKNRIRNIGHLSNDQCADLLYRVIKKSKRYPRAVILAHISQECNTNEIAENSTVEMIEKNNFNGIDVVLTHRRKPNRIVTIE